MSAVAMKEAVFGKLLFTLPKECAERKRIKNDIIDHGGKIVKNDPAVYGKYPSTWHLREKSMTEEERIEQELKVDKVLSLEFVKDSLSNNKLMNPVEYLIFVKRAGQEASVSTPRKKHNVPLAKTPASSGKRGASKGSTITHWTDEEKEKLIEYAKRRAKEEGSLGLTGNLIWQDAAKLDIIPGRSAQAMRECYKRLLKEKSKQAETGEELLNKENHAKNAREEPQNGEAADHSSPSDSDSDDAEKQAKKEQTNGILKEDPGKEADDAGDDIDEEEDGEDLERTEEKAATAKRKRQARKEEEDESSSESNEGETIILSKRRCIEQFRRRDVNRTSVTSVKGQLSKLAKATDSSFAEASCAFFQRNGNINGAKAWLIGQDDDFQPWRPEEDEVLEALAVPIYAAASRRGGCTWKEFSQIGTKLIGAGPLEKNAAMMGQIFQDKGFNAMIERVCFLRNFKELNARIAEED